MAEKLYGFDDSKSKVTLKSGSGITVGEDGTIGHNNEVTPKTSYVGSATAVPRIKFDENGHITEVTTATVYPPTTPGEAGQVWTSDGAGAGKWAEPAGGKKIYTGTLASLFKIVDSTIVVESEIEIEYIYSRNTGSYNNLYISIGKIMPGIYTGSANLAIVPNLRVTTIASNSLCYVSLLLASSAINTTVYVAYDTGHMSFTTTGQITTDDLSTMEHGTYAYRIWV